MTPAQADKRALEWVRRYPRKKIEALSKVVLMRDAYARGLRAAERRGKITKPIRLHLS